MKDTVTTKLSNEALAPLLAYRLDHRGFVSVLTARLNRRTRQTWRIQKVMAWLHPDPRRRPQPPFGAGLLLVEVGKEVIAEKESEN